MSLTTILFAFLVISILGVICGILKKNKTIIGVSLGIFILIISIFLFLIFVLIPSM